jgi:type I restriction enzyme R subunit
MLTGEVRSQIDRRHAEFIAERFNVHYPHYRGEFARVIDFQIEYAETLIDNFAIAARAPHIAISVDMLDTGIDVPEVVNLVFFKLVRSKTKFWQMLGRGTRLCTDLFGPGSHKEFFYVFDHCQNLEFFSQNPPATDGVAGDSLGTRLFKARLQLIGELDAKRTGETRPRPIAHAEPAASFGGPATDEELRDETAELLRAQVAAMNVNNFVVRPKRRLVEKYAKLGAWAELSSDSLAELSRDVANLPAEIDAEEEEAKRPMSSWPSSVTFAGEQRRRRRRRR